MTYTFTEADIGKPLKTRNGRKAEIVAIREDHLIYILDGGLSQPTAKITTLKGYRLEGEYKNNLDLMPPVQTVTIWLAWRRYEGGGWHNAGPVFGTEDEARKFHSENGWPQTEDRVRYEEITREFPQ